MFHRLGNAGRPAELQPGSSPGVEPDGPDTAEVGPAEVGAAEVGAVAVGGVAGCAGRRAVGEGRRRRS